MFNAAVQKQNREKVLLSPSKIRHTVESLHRRKLVARISCGGRVVKFQTGITDDQLREAEVAAEVPSDIRERKKPDLANLFH